MFNYRHLILSVTKRLHDLDERGVEILHCGKQT